MKEECELCQPMQTERGLYRKASSVEEAKSIFERFISSPDRHNEEKIFAAYWLVRGKKEGLAWKDAWDRLALKAAEQGDRIGDGEGWNSFAHRVRKAAKEVKGEIYDDQG